MEFRRVKNTRWQNLKATIKNFVYDYVKTHKEQLENGEPIADDTYLETNQSTLQLFTTDDSDTPAFGIISLNDVLMYLSIQLSLYENTKYYDNCKMEDESYESEIHIGDNLSDLDLEIVARLYGDAIWNAAAYGIDDELPKDFRDSMKICDITLKGKKVPIYLGSLYDMIDGSNNWCSTLVINFYANIARHGHFASERIEQLVKVLMMIPYRDTQEVYWAYISESSNLKMLRLVTTHNRDALQKFFTKTVLLINPDPNFIRTMFNTDIPDSVIDDPYSYYRKIRDFLNELSDAGINMMELVAGANYRQLLQIEKFVDRERNVFRLAGCLSGSVISNLGRDVIEQLNEFITVSAERHELLEDNPSNMLLSLQGSLLAHFGVTINSDISGYDPTIFSTLEEKMRAEDLKVESNRQNIHTVSSVMNCSTEVLTCLDAMEGLLLSSFKTDGDNGYLIDRLSLPAFMAFMKLYAHTACYTYTDTFKASVGAYNSDPEKEGLIPLLFESFRLYFRNNKNPFRYLSYVVDPALLMKFVVRRIELVSDTERYEHDMRPICRIFEISRLAIIRTYGQICSNNNAAIANPNLIVQFLVSGSCKQMDPMYLKNFVFPPEPGAPRTRFLMRYITQEEAKKHNHSDNRNAFRNDRMEVHLEACETIADTILDNCRYWSLFQSALFHITELFPSNNVIAVINYKEASRIVNRNSIDPAAILFMDYLAMHHRKN
nr:MAG TPA: hypothetical protein [Caudoviricetes sp.]